MKHPHTPLSILIIGAMTCAGFSTASAQSNVSQPVVITPPAIRDGSNQSRAPFPAKRQFDDVKAPDGQAIDNLPPNTPATNTEPPGSQGAVAILQPAAPAATYATTTTVPATTTVAVTTPSVAVTTDTAGLTPTGRVSVASSIDATTFAPTIRSATYANREQLIADIESKLAASEQAIAAASTTAAGEARQAWDKASDEAKKAAKKLRNSLAKARNATENAWDKTRMQLAAEFDEYSAALARIDSANR